MTQINFSPAKGYVVIEVPEVSEKTDAGIIKTETMMQEEKSKQDQFLTIAVAHDESEYKSGDRILLLANLTAANGFEMHGKKFLVINEAHVLGVAQ